MTAGSIIFSDGTNFVEDNANLFWDNTNKRIGIGTSSPARRLHVGAGTGVEIARIAGGSGTGEGSLIEFLSGSVGQAIGTKSAILGSGTSADLLFFTTTATGMEWRVGGGTLAATVNPAGVWDFPISLSVAAGANSQFYVLRPGVTNGTLLQMQRGTGASPISIPDGGENVINLQAIGTTGAGGSNRYINAIATDARLIAGVNGTALGAYFVGQLPADSTWTTTGVGLGGATGFFAHGISYRGASIFGGNVYAHAHTVIADEVTGFEINTNNTINGTGSKKGLQIVDLSTSTGSIASVSDNIALLFKNQIGAYGFDYGIKFEAGVAQFPVRAGGALIYANGGNVAIGLDFAGMTFSSGRWAAMPNATYLACYNAAGDALRNAIGLTSGHLLSLYDSTVLITAGTNARIKLTGSSGTSQGPLFELNDGTTAHIFGTTGAVLGGTDRGFMVWNSHATAPTRFYTNAAERMHIGVGVVVGAPSGGDKGAGTINAVAVYDDNVLLTDYALEAANENGRIDLNKWDKLAPGGKHGPARSFITRGGIAELDPEIYSNLWRRRGVLPGMPTPDEWANSPLSTGAMIQRLWETAELHAVHSKRLMERIARLEKRAA